MHMCFNSTRFFHENKAHNQIDMSGDSKSVIALWEGTV